MPPSLVQSYMAEREHFKNFAFASEYRQGAAYMANRLTIRIIILHYA